MGYPAPPQNDALKYLMAQDNLQAGSGGGASGQDKIFTGWKKIDSPQGIHTVGNYKTVGDLTNQFYGSWSRDKISSLGQRLASAGWIQVQDVGNIAAVGAAYEKVLALVAQMNAAGRQITVNDVLSHYIGGAGSGPSRPSSYSTTTKDVDLTNPKTARALMIQSLQQRLGRDPSAAEQQAFLASLHAAEREDPTVRTSHYKLNPGTGQYETTSQTTKGGVDPSAYASDYSGKHNQKEYGAYQAAATYFPALMDAVAATV